MAERQSFQQIAAGAQARAGLSGSASSPASTSNATATPQMSLEQAQAQAETAFSGVVAPMTLEQIRARESEANLVTGQVADSTFDPQISREKQTGAAQVSTGEGVVGQRQGFNISTAEQAFVANIQNQVQDRVKEVENAKASYLAQGNLAAAERADNQLQQLNEFNTQMALAKANYALQIMSGNREQAQLTLAQQQAKVQEAQQNKQLDLSEIELLTKIPEGKTFTFNGQTYTGMKSVALEPFFSGSDIISLMKQIPAGTTQTLLDPNTGKEYKVTGSDKSGVVLKESTDNAGNVTYQTVDISSGTPKVVGTVSGGKVGKSGGSGTSVSVTMKNSAVGGIADKMYDVGGNEFGKVAYNEQTGKYTFTDLQGNSIAPPAYYTTTAPKASEDNPYPDL